MILSEIQRFLHTLFNSIDDDLIFLVSVGFQLLLTIFFIIKSHYSYEMRVVKRLVKLNSWLNENQYIDSNNLLAFNDLMKKTPKLLRHHWHQYMLYREEEPSYYMSPYNCIEKPLKTSSYRTNIKNYTLMSMILALSIFIFSIAGLGTVEFQFLYLTKAFYIPVAIMLLNMIFVIILRGRENQNLNALYQYFHYFNRFLDKAVTTMPPYVDFEVLFTRKEIRKGIPVLNEYLEKRARQEQEELEKARLYAVEHETYDFSDAGLNGSLVLDRAMKEAETYLNVRQRLLSEIEQFESEMDSLKRNYESNLKEYEKRMQASKENVIRFKTQQEESISRIETNYIKKQQLDEIKKQEQLERDHESATVRFNQEMEVLIAEIDTRKTDLEQKRLYVEEAMKAEYQTFSLKLYNNITNIIEEKNEKEKEILIAMKDEIAEQLDQALIFINDKDKEIQELRKILKSHKIKVGGYAGFHSEKLQDEAKKLRHGNKYQEIKDAILTKAESKRDDNLLELEESLKIRNKSKADNDDDDNDKKGFIELESSEKKVETPTKEKASTKKSILEKNVQNQFDSVEEPIEEPVGYYDKAGNFCFKTGGYYDAQGNFHDEHDGWYDEKLNYHKKDSKSVETDSDETFNKKDEVKEQEKETDLIQKEQDTQPNDANDIKSLLSKNEILKLEEEANKLKEDKVSIKESEPLKSKKENNTIKTANEKGGSSEKDNSKPAEPKVKRGPGRPRKVVDPNAKPKVKRGPGRPRKNPTKIETEPKAKRGPGRPRKNPEKPVENVGKLIDKASQHNLDSLSGLEDIDTLNQKIASENEKIKKQQNELKNELDEALFIFDEKIDKKDDSNKD